MTLYLFYLRRVSHILEPLKDFSRLRGEVCFKGCSILMSYEMDPIFRGIRNNLERVRLKTTVYITGCYECAPNLSGANYGQPWY